MNRNALAVVEQPQGLTLDQVKDALRIGSEERRIAEFIARGRRTVRPRR